MKYFIKFIVGISIFLSTSVFAQTNDLYLVNLKSGLTLKCELIKIVPDSFVLVRQYGLVNKINITEVKSIEFAESIIKYIASNNPKKYLIVKRGLPDSSWSFGYQVGGCIGSYEGRWGRFLTSSFTIRVNMMRGFGSRFMGGFGIGIDPYGYTGIVVSPLVAEGRYFLAKKVPQSVFLYADAGFSMNLVSIRTLKDGGPTVTLGIGRMYRTKRQNMFGFMFGWRYQSAVSTVNDFSTLPVRTFEATNIFRRAVGKVEWRF